MHGLGNDFIVIHNMNGRISLTTEQIVSLCDRHRGIGADGLILVESSDKGDCFMNYMNADGSKAEMCGNGVRCVTKFVKDNILKDKKSFKIETRAGVKTIDYKEDGTYSVNMGPISFSHKDFPKEPMSLEGFNLNFVAMGNPFAIAFVDDVSKYNLNVIGPLIENNKNFPNRINFEIVEEKEDGEFKVRVWERGCGETLACGSGACSIYALLKSLGKVEGSAGIEFRGGRLVLSSDNDNNIIMEGPAVSVFSSIVEV